MLYKLTAHLEHVKSNPKLYCHHLHLEIFEPQLCMEIGETDVKCRVTFCDRLNRPSSFVNDQIKSVT